MTKTKYPNDILVFSGPEFALMTLAPDKAFYPNVTKSQLMRILESKERLWGPNLGDATLHWCAKEKYEGSNCYVPNPNRPSLVILFHKDFGFHVRFDVKSKNVKTKNLLAIDPKVKSVRVKQVLCGEPAYFPSSTYFPLATAKKIVQQFVDSESRFDGVSWIETTSFRYDLPNEWKKLGKKAIFVPSEGNKKKRK